MCDKTALILVDLQYDFAHPAGALYVPGGKEVIGLANKLMPHFDKVVATRDWHPPDHCSLIERRLWAFGQQILVEGLPQTLWPIHCVKDTPGAAIHLNIDLDKIHRIINKGTNQNIDSYSAFFDNARRNHTELETYLSDKEIKTIYIMGLATDYCVKFTVLDACELGFKVFVIEDGCRAINAANGLAAFEEMKKAGADIIGSAIILEKSP
jgi:nicotinamidase/pyrazinamidase